ncbi:hypothetical protein [Psychroserpens damuponensis]|uniref:hypothetical protein n=1 Tax=Psychroserpens damuponensis TaxID=943936 RepID=UPI00058BDA83|nr:hypothetical protein [Psychroserpens damuponensis]
MKKVCLHIGYPKCLSTTLQRSFFEKHPQINYAGVGINDNISYVNKDIEFIFESLLKYANDCYWNQNKKQAKKTIEEFVNNSSLLSLFSSEHLGFKFSQQQIDSVEKIKRLAFLFSDFEVSIFIIEREPINLLKSLYREFLKMGYKDNYTYFMRELVALSDRNFLSDLNILNKKSQLKEHFYNVDITCLNFEDLTKNQEFLNVTLSSVLRIDNHKLPIKNDNPSISNEHLSKLLKYNQMHPRELGLSQYEPFERHRNRIVYQRSELDYKEEEIFRNVINKRLVLNKAFKGDKNTSYKNLFQLTDLEELVLQKIRSFNP